jgi:ribosomal protein S18 acetylase RimI-like enzyme
LKHPRPKVRIARVSTAREARTLDGIDAEVWGSRGPGPHRYFGQFLGYGMRVYRATLDGEPAGAMVTGYGTSADLMEVEEIMVLPGFRRRGVGRALLEYARREARRRGMRGIVVEVDIQNRRARDWYRSCGMSTVGMVLVDNKKAWIEEERPVGPARKRRDAAEGGIRRGHGRD